LQFFNGQLQIADEDDCAELHFCPRNYPPFWDFFHSITTPLP